MAGKGGRSPWDRYPATGICLTDEERSVWFYLNRNAGIYRAESPCEDCTPEWQAQMRAIDNCDGPTIRKGNERMYGTAERMTRSEAQTLRRSRERGGDKVTLDKPGRVCQTEGCDQRLGHGGLHSKRCTVPDCHRKHLARGLCKSHYIQMKRREKAS